MINLSISTPFKKLVRKEWFIASVEQTFNSEEIDTILTDVSILVRDDAFIRKYKKEYFGIDEATDVLSFPAGETSPETNHYYLGDIILSYPQAENNAKQANKSTQQEIKLLVIHGILHLLGYDHADEKTQKVMWEKQESILRLLPD